MLSVEGMVAGYGSRRVLHGIGFSVERGAIVALLGANGAGKTTTLKALSGVIPAEGRITLDGCDLLGLDPARRVRMGLAHIPQGRGTFADFTVEENLRLGAHSVRSREQIGRDIERWYAAFPRLRERRRQAAGTLSGGEQQMLAFARALMSRPKVLMCDEPSLGLAPAIVQDLFASIARLNAEEGTTILIVEQNADLTLRIAHRAFVMEAGVIASQGLAADLLADPSVRRAYLGA
ncbi:MAG: ABC transporter ATP-binding protein [Methylobacterium frigidaeris]